MCLRVCLCGVYIKWSMVMWYASKWEGGKQKMKDDDKWKWFGVERQEAQHSERATREKNDQKKHVEEEERGKMTSEGKENRKQWVVHHRPGVEAQSLDTPCSNGGGGEKEGGFPLPRGQMRTRESVCLCVCGCTQVHICRWYSSILVFMRSSKKAQLSAKWHKLCDLMPHPVSHYRQRGISSWMKPVKSQIKTIWKVSNGADLIQITQRERERERVDETTQGNYMQLEKLQLKQEK